MCGLVCVRSTNVPEANVSTVRGESPLCQKPVDACHCQFLQRFFLFLPKRAGFGLNSFNSPFIMSMNTSASRRTHKIMTLANFRCFLGTFVYLCLEQQIYILVFYIYNIKKDK